ncbi:hypothetical protein PHSY_002539 [Pseudozyma hubeiensis SY62]|uniref:Uncharacterized protein n=1 Tax=Pseudozyma hubeiensis (strain SY62) TaxID=1305764 RepID=R9P173_PSEHS|nr:hypothetical protein PHSY_002539 [Pseudozyma hubeiensis SY62]GAC94966.1 hypothetical protein PHSY_002539 [Pseudozyma hubeiensis SY62]
MHGNLHRKQGKSVGASTTWGKSSGSSQRCRSGLDLSNGDVRFHRYQLQQHLKRRQYVTKNVSGAEYGR